MSGHYKQWSADRDAELTALWDANHTQDSIAKTLMRSKGSIYERAKFLKLPLRALSNVNKKMGFWTKEKDAALTALFAEGKSHTEIAKEIGAASRNACIGRAHRLGLRRNDEANLKNKRANAANGRRASADAAARRRATTPAKPKPKPAPKPRLVVCGNNTVIAHVDREPRAKTRKDVWAPLPGSAPRHFGEVKASECRWPIDTPDGPLLRCCEPIQRGGYCADHAVIAYAAPKEPGKRAINSLIRSTRRYA